MSAGDDDEAFAVVTTHLPSGVLEVLVVGELDLLTAPGLQRSVIAELDAGATDVDVVLNAVTFCDSSGLVGLLGLHEAVVLGGGRFRLVAPSAPVRQVVALMGLAGYFEIG